MLHLVQFDVNGVFEDGGGPARQILLEAQQIGLDLINEG
jgi:hypothetical protein